MPHAPSAPPRRPRAPQAPGREQQRQRLIRLIHVARRELGLDEASYRSILRRAGAADSSAQMDVAALQAVRDYLVQRCGFKVRAQSASARPDRAQDRSAAACKVRALWLSLHALGALRDPSERALAAYVLRIAKVEDLHWASSRDLHTLIESLKKWALRYLRPAVQALQGQLAALSQPLPAAQAQAAAQALACLQRGAGYDVQCAAWLLLRQALGQPLAPALSAALLVLAPGAAAPQQD